MVVLSGVCVLWCMYSWSASRKNILHRFVVYKREAPKYFSLARIYRDSFLLVCEGSYGNRIVLYDATKEIHDYTQRRRTEALERRRKKNEASSSQRNSDKTHKKENPEKEGEGEEDAGGGGGGEDESKNVDSRNVDGWDAEELRDLDGDCGVCDENGFDLPKPPVVTPDKKKPSVRLLFCLLFSQESCPPSDDLSADRVPVHSI